jgi:hypothetical protein
VLVFPDVADPLSQTYDEVVGEIGDAGVWLPVDPIPEAELEAFVKDTVEKANAFDPEAYAQEMKRRMSFGAKLAALRDQPTKVGSADLDAAAKKLGLGS